MMIGRVQRIGLSAVALLGMTGVAFGATLHVPDQYPTIGAAMSASADGDRIVVGPGDYFESVDFDGRNVELVSSNGPAVTTIDASFSNASAVLFVSGEDDALIEGERAAARIVDVFERDLG